jgi:anoctamin-10
MDSNLNSNYNDPIKELLKVQVKDTSQFKGVKKAWSKGGFLEKRVYDQKDYDWVCSNGQPKDFLTLVRFTIMAKLCRNANLHTRSFISGDGRSIFMVIKSN